VHEIGLASGRSASVEPRGRSPAPLATPGCSPKRASQPPPPLPLPPSAFALAERERRLLLSRETHKGMRGWREVKREFKRCMRRITPELVDKYSAILFPTAYFIFNIGYWGYYLTELSSVEEVMIT